MSLFTAIILLCAAVLAIAWLLAWLHEHGVHPFRAALGIFRRPLLEVVLILVMVGSARH